MMELINTHPNDVFYRKSLLGDPICFSTADARKSSMSGRNVPTRDTRSIIVSSKIRPGRAISRHKKTPHSGGVWKLISIEV
jgi:hypothetical protein